MIVSLTTFRDRLPSIAATLPLPAHLSRDSCQIELLADRIANLQTGPTYPVYRDWRFAVVCGSASDRVRHPRFTVPVAALPGTPSHARNAMELQPGQGDIAVGDVARFTWVTTTIGTINPFAVAHDQAQQWLVAEGWQPDLFPPEQDREAPLPEGAGLASLAAWEDEGGSPSHGGHGGS